MLVWHSHNQNSQYTTNKNITYHCKQFITDARLNFASTPLSLIYVYFRCPNSFITCNIIFKLNMFNFSIIDNKHNIINNNWRFSNICEHYRLEHKMNFKIQTIHSLIKKYSSNVINTVNECNIYSIGVVVHDMRVIILIMYVIVYFYNIFKYLAKWDNWKCDKNYTSFRCFFHLNYEDLQTVLFS